MKAICGLLLLMIGVWVPCFVVGFLLGGWDTPLDATWYSAPAGISSFITSAACIARGVFLLVDWADL